MTTTTKRIGLSLGADICWPICFEEILRRLALAIPLGRDQPATARRVEAVGAGVVVPVDASPADLRDALGSVLEQPTYRTSARRFAAEYDPAASVAISELEALAHG